MFGESFEEAWRQRYGEEPGVAYPPLAPYLWHRCVREYSDREVPETLVAALVGAAQSAGTSSNLQLYSIISVQDPERRRELSLLCGDQEHVRRAPWFFAFCADHYRIRRAAEAVGESAAGLDFEEFLLMAVIDAALACERMVCAAEALGLGVCYIGALRNHAPGASRLLGLPKGVFGAFGLCLGWPAEGCEAKIKPRLAQANVWMRERYDPEADVAEYDARMRGFYESEKMKGEVTWSMRSGRRVDDRHLSGREILKGWLESQGFQLR